LLFVNQKAKFSRKIYYESCSFSIYKKRAAIAIAGKTRPTSGTKIEGRYKLIRKNLELGYDSAESILHISSADLCLAT
jgi:hypothetical protein